MQNKEKLERLEQVEKLLLEKIGKTQMSQHDALANLHKAVQICNAGIKDALNKNSSRSLTKQSMKDASQATMDNSVFVTVESNTII